MPIGTIYTITAQGIENGLRGAKDGFTYFGCKKRKCKSSIRHRKGEIINDVIIKNPDKEISQRHRGKHFQIQYVLDSNCYKIRDLGIGFGAYAKLENPLILQDNHLLSMGESFFIVNLLPDTDIEKRISKAELPKKDDLHTKLRIKVFAGPANGELLYP